MPNASYRMLRRLRVCLSVVFLVVLTVAIADAGFGVTRFGLWLREVQLIPAIVLGAGMWLVLWVVLTLLFGRVYCSSVCPLGTVQDMAAHLGRRFSKGEGRRYRYSPPVNVLRFTVPVIVGICLFAGFTIVLEVTDPYTIYYNMVQAVARPASIALGSLLLSGVLLVAVCAIAWRKGRILCNTVCPAGGMLGLLGRQPIYRVDINTDKCIHCGRCEDVCKSACIDLKDCVVDNSRCVMCIDCTAVCPNDAITIRRGRYRLSTPMMISDSRSLSAAQPQSDCKVTG